MPYHDRVHGSETTFDIGTGTDLHHFVGIRDCLAQRNQRVSRLFKHHRDLLDIVLGAENLLECQVDDSRTHVR